MFSCQLNSQFDFFSQNGYCCEQPVLSIRLNQTPSFTQAQVAAIAGNGQYFALQEQFWNEQATRAICGGGQQQGLKTKTKGKAKKKKKAVANGTTGGGAVGGSVTKSGTSSKQSESNRLKVQNELLKALAKSIEPSNKGFEMMRKMGYKDGTALGKTGCGIVEPIPIELKHDRKGLGVPAKPNVEPKKLSKKQRKRLRQEEANKALKTSSPEPMDVDKEVSTVKQHSLKKTPPKVAEQTKANKVIPKPRKHSPIRAPSPEPVNVQKPNITPPAKVTKTTTTPKNTIAPKPSTTKKLPKRPKFALQEPTTTQQLQSIALHFREEIELLNLRLETEASFKGASNDKLILAKIFICNNTTFAQHTFEFIRTEIVGWIGKYQHQQLETPIFHSMRNNETHILVVCEDLYAYDCLHKCIEEITETRTIAPIAVVKDPPINKALYCYGAVYSGIIRDPKLFLMQVKLHKAALKADRWIVISHEVCSSMRETYFLFLLDEPSALALTYHHHDKLFICMQLVEFTMRGRVPPEK